MCGVGDLSVSFAFQSIHIYLLIVLCECIHVYLCGAEVRSRAPNEFYYLCIIIFWGAYTYRLDLRLYVESLLHKGEHRKTEDLCSLQRYILQFFQCRVRLNSVSRLCVRLLGSFCSLLPSV